MNKIYKLFMEFMNYDIVMDYNIINYEKLFNNY